MTVHNFSTIVRRNLWCRCVSFRHQNEARRTAFPGRQRRPGKAVLPGLFALLALASVATGADEARLLRFPAIHGKQVAFTYAGDLYTVSASGGVARKLTNHAGYEMFARFSPDGRWIAFTGQYDGNTEVYLMAAEGSAPKRLTYTASLSRDDPSDRMGPNNIIIGWKDDRTVVYRGRAGEWNAFRGQLYTVSIDGGLPEQLPLPRGGWCSYSPDKKKLAYNRVFREFRTWKRYRGGQADDIWIYDFQTKTTTNLTDCPAQDVFPMWVGENIYFVSDRDELKRMNLYVFDLKTKGVRQLTHFKDFDVKFPSLGDTAIVFENGGYIYRFDLASQKARKIPIYLHEDFAVGRGGLKEVGREIDDYEISPDGSRALFGARGDIFTVPARYGNTRNLTNTPGQHERSAVWSPDGRSIAFISDATGEDEIYVMSQGSAGTEQKAGGTPAPQDGKAGGTPALRSGAPVRITSNADTYKYSLHWSPDSRKIMWTDKKQRLQYVDVESKAVTLVNQATAWEIHHCRWSPDSQWIVYTRPEDRQMPRIYLYSVQAKTTYPVTDGWSAAGDAVFSGDGKYLLFISKRNFNPHYGDTEWNHIYSNMDGIYLVTLAKTTPSPFAPKSDEVQVTKDEKPGDATGLLRQLVGGTSSKSSTAKGGATTTRIVRVPAPKVVVKVDPEGLEQRIAALPIAAGNYGGLTSVGDKLYYLAHGSEEHRTSHLHPTHTTRRLMMFDFDKQKETEIGECSGYEISADGRKMLVRMRSSFAIIDVPTAKMEVTRSLDLSGMTVMLDREAEWRQIYRECWRQMRDFVYAPNMQGVDWPKIRDRYEPLLKHVKHRIDLTYVIGEMIGELNLGHCYVGGGDYPKAERIPIGLLGAKIERDPKSGYYRIGHILKGQNWDRNLRSPLTEIGVDVREGDYILAIDGRPTNQMPNIYASLVNTVGKQVTLEVNAQPRPQGSRRAVVVPIADERPLVYLNWVLKNIDRVSKATDGKIGYVHIPNMEADGLNEFAKFYYPQLNKEGLIVDVRGNAGGNVSPQIIERLRREPTMFTVARNAAVNVDPSGMVLGPKVMLIDEFSASDGDIVAYRFKKHKLGQVIGKRTWGGVVGIRGTLPLLDGGYLERPEFSRYDLAGREWIMEGHGVDPDIVVDNDPAREFEGVDDQLERAIAIIKESLKKEPVKIPPPPPYPDKSK